MIKNFLKLLNEIGNIMYPEEYSIENFITEEMCVFFEKRTRKHIETVQKYASRIPYSFLGETNIFYGNENSFENWNKFQEQVRNHDESKFQAPEVKPYILQTWRYRCKLIENKEFLLPESIDKMLYDATLYHIKNNPHHPEYYTDKIFLNVQDRDKPANQIVDATLMPMNYIVEMVCDWCAVGEERNTSPHDWAKSNINIRWKFTDPQVKQIYSTLEVVYGSK